VFVTGLQRTQSRCCLSCCVQQLKLPGLTGQGQVFILPMYLHQPLSQPGKLLRGYRGAIDPCPRPAGGGDAPPKQALMVIVQIFLDQPFPHPGMPGQVKLSAKLCTLSAVPDPGRIRATAQQEPKRVDEYGFAGAGFTRDGGKPTRKFEIQFGRDGEISDVEMPQHGLLEAGSEMMAKASMPRGQRQCAKCRKNA